MRTTTLSLAREERDTVPSGSPPEPPRILHPGTLLRGRWRILRFLGRGGMGVVHEAVDIATGERVALKVLPAHAWNDADALASLRDELLVARRVSHHNVCRVHEIYLEPSAGSGEPAFFTMEFLEGETLAARLQREGRLDEDTTLGLVRQLAAGLQAAHEVGVVHRDLKPGNVMLVPDGDGLRAVITDFGVAWAGARSRSTGDGTDRIVGSPAYMSPEQVEGGRISPASDIFALGVLLYELVTGVLPFQRATSEEVTRVQHTSTPVPPSRLVAALSSRWNRTILSCLRSDPARRPQSAAAVVRSLERDRRATGVRMWVIAAAIVGVAAGLVPGVAERLRSSSAAERRPRTHSADLFPAAAQPRSELAARRYAEALEAHRHFDEVSAGASLREVLQLEPGFVRARALLAEVLEQVGEDERARAEAARAVADAASLPEPERRAFSALQARLAGNQARAASEYASLLAARPGDLETGLLLASVQSPAEALGTLEALRHIQGPAGSDLRIELAAVKVQLESDPEAAVRRLQALEERLIASQQPLLVAQGLVYRGDVLTTLGRLGEAEAALAEAEPLLAGAGNAGWAAEVKRMRSDVVALAGRWQEAQRLRSEVLEAYLRLGAPAKAARAAEDLLQSALVAGRIAEAHRWFDRAVQLLSEAGIDPARLGAREATLAMSEANMPRRRQALERWVDWAAQKGDPPPTNSRQLLAWVLYDEDRLEDALASVAALEAEKPKGFAAISLGDLKASILLEQGHAAEAVKLLNQAFDTPVLARSPMLQLRRGDILGRALGATGAVDAALTTVRNAMPQARPPQPVNYALRLRLREVDLLRLGGQVAEARREMAAVWADVPPDHKLLRMEARLVRGRLDLTSGRWTRARADLSLLSEEASRAGFHRLARLARESMSAPKERT